MWSSNSNSGSCVFLRWGHTGKNPKNERSKRRSALIIVLMYSMYVYDIWRDTRMISLCVYCHEYMWNQGFFPVFKVGLCISDPFGFSVSELGRSLAVRLFLTHQLPTQKTRQQQQQTNKQNDNKTTKKENKQNKTTPKQKQKNEDNELEIKTIRPKSKYPRWEDLTFFPPGLINCNSIVPSGVP